MRPKRKTRRDGSDPKPVATREEAYPLLMRLVEAFENRSLFTEALSRRQAFSAMNAAIEADDELREIVRRLPPGYPDAAVADGVRGDLKILLVQEFVAQRKDDEADNGGPRIGYRLSAIEIYIGLLCWAGGLWLERSAHLAGWTLSVGGIIVAADGCFRWHMSSPRNTGSSRRDPSPGTGIQFRLQVAAALWFIGGPFESRLPLGYRIWFGILGAILIWNVLGILGLRGDKSRP